MPGICDAPVPPARAWVPARYACVHLCVCACAWVPARAPTRVRVCPCARVRTPKNLQIV